MKRFVDKQGTTWIVRVTDQAIAELQHDAEMDLTTLGTPAGEAIEQAMVQGPDVTTAALIVICRGQRVEQKISQDELASRVADAHAAARDALLDDLFDWARNAATKARFRNVARAIRAAAAAREAEAVEPATKPAGKAKKSKAKRESQKPAEPEAEAEPQPQEPAESSEKAEAGQA